MLSANSLTLLEQHQPDIVNKLKTVMHLATEATDNGLLALCSGYIDAAVRQQDWIPPQGTLTGKEQAFIDFTEQFISSVSTMSDAQVERLLEFATADEVYAFINAIYVVDMTRRLELVAGRVLA